MLKHNSQFWPTWALTWDQNPICLYRSCYSGPLKCSTWVLTQEWVLAWDTRIILHYYNYNYVLSEFWDWDGPVPLSADSDDDGVVIPETICPLNDSEFAQLQSLCSLSPSK